MASPFFARIKRDCLAITAHIPSGKVTTFVCMGKYLDVPPRHVAYVLATLTEDELRDCPWWRVVGNDGHLGKPKLGEHGISQAEFLDNEGVQVEDLRVIHFEQHCVETLSLNSGIAQKTRPVDAPKR
jgi:methylated-DNA-protein-cysteine methyltransferase related protein